MTAVDPPEAPPSADHRIFATGGQKLLGHLAMLLFAGLVAGSFSIGGLAAPFIGPSAINVARFLFGTAIMGGVAAFAVKGGVGLPRAPWRFLVLGLLMAVFMVTMFAALKLTTPVATGAVFTLMPLMSAGFGWMFLGQAPRAVVILSLVVAAAGSVWVIFRGDLAALMAFEVGPGEMIFFVGCICHAAYAPLVRRFNRGEAVAAFTFWTLFATGACIAFYGAGEIAATEWAALPATVWLAIGYLSVFTTAGTFFLLQFASMRLPASKALAYSYLTPSFIIFYEGLLGHGWASAGVMVGALITVLGLAVMAAARD